MKERCESCDCLSGKTIHVPICTGCLKAFSRQKFKAEFGEKATAPPSRFCPACGKRLRANVPLASHLGNCDYRPRLIARRKKSPQAAGTR